MLHQLHNLPIHAMLRKLYIEENPVQGVESILDIGTGTGGSAFVLGQLFPEVYRYRYFVTKNKKHAAVLEIQILACFAFFDTNFVKNIW